jgi:hypothetical protein
MLGKSLIQTYHNFVNEYQEYPYGLGHRGILAFDIRNILKVKVKSKCSISINRIYE